MDAKFPRRIAARSNDAPLARAADEKRLAPQAAVLQTFYGNKKGIQIEMKYGSFKHWLGLMASPRIKKRSYPILLFFYMITCWFYSSISSIIQSIQLEIVEDLLWKVESEFTLYKSDFFIISTISCLFGGAAFLKYNFKALLKAKCERVIFANSICLSMIDSIILMSQDNFLKV